MVWAVSPRSCFPCTAFLCQSTWSRSAGLAISSDLAWPLLSGVLSSKFHFTRLNINVKRNVEGISGPSAYTQPGCWTSAGLGFTALPTLRLRVGSCSEASGDLALLHSELVQYVLNPTTTSSSTSHPRYGPPVSNYSRWCKRRWHCLTGDASN